VTAKIEPSPAQSGIMDELKAEPLRQTEAGIIARKEGGEIVEITPDGEIRDPNADQPPGPITMEEVAGELVPADVSDADAFKPPETTLAVVSDDDVFRAMDRADEMLILDEIQGRALDTWVYSYTNKRNELITNLSVHGVNETVRLLNERGGLQLGISEQPPLVDEKTEADGKSYYRVMVFARDGRKPHTGRWGTAVEPKMMEFRKGGEGWDKFALTKALNKAQRNALAMLIPEDFRAHIIAQALGHGRVQKLLPAAAPTAALEEGKPVLADERAEELKKEIRDAYSELKELNRQAIRPGHYNTMLSSAERESHERLEELRDHVISAVEYERGKAEEARQEAEKRASQAQAGDS
jgi:hypothetical protein